MEKTFEEIISQTDEPPFDEEVPSTIGVDVWACVTIYVEADSDEEAAAIVAERYAGSRDKIGGYNPIGGEDIPMDDVDFMSSAMTFYGLSKDSDLFAAVDPVRDAASDMKATLQQALDAWPDWESDEPVNGGDMVEWFGTWRESVKAAIAKAEGRTA